MATHAVTGPFSYTGSYIRRRLTGEGIQVRGFVRTPTAAPEGIDCRPLQFADQDRLIEDLRGTEVLYNTYWIRFERHDSTFDQAVRNTAVLAEAAQRAGVSKLVHISVSNAAHDSPFAYFRGKAAAEDAVTAPGIPTSIIRPTLVFGKEDILVNNIAWMLRRFHVFPVPGRGRYRVQPVYVGDVADLAVREAAAGPGTIDAAGPEVLTFAGLVQLLARHMGIAGLVLPSPSQAPLWAARVLSKVLNDVVITDEELGALMAETLVSHSSFTAPTRLTEWLAANGDQLGRGYTSEMKRHWSSNPNDGRQPQQPEE